MTRTTRSGHQVLARPLSCPRTPSLNLVALMLAAAALGWMLGRSDPGLENEGRFGGAVKAGEVK